MRLSESLLPDRDFPAIHIWTSPDGLPDFQPARVPALVLAGRPVPEEIIRERSKDWRARPLTERLGWRILETPSGVIRGDVPEEGLARSGVYLEELHVLLRAALGGEREARFSVELHQE